MGILCNFESNILESIFKRAMIYFDFGAPFIMPPSLIQSFDLNLVKVKFSKTPTNYFNPNPTPN